MLSPSIVISLGLTVWIIYTLDHLMDARNTAHKASTLRHRFHQKYFKEIASILILALIGAGVSLFFLPVLTLRLGVLLTVVVVIYFVLLQMFRRHNLYLKEISIGLIYTLGLFLGPVSLIQEMNWMVLAVLFIQFFALSTANLMIFAYFEMEIDEKDGHGSLARLLGKKRVRSFCLLLVLLVLTVTASPLSLSLGQFRWFIFGMALILGSLIYRPSFFRKNEAYRVLGDGIFLLPLFIL